MPPTPKCPHDSGTYIDVVGSMELTKCVVCNEVLLRRPVGSDPHDD